MSIPESPLPLPRVLVVDDSPDSLWLMGELLGGRYEVLQAASGREALALANAKPPPDLMLLDIIMPDMDGYEVLRRLRQQPSTAGIPVAFMTSLGAAEQQLLGRELGAVDYLTKPVDVREVIQRVEAHVRERQEARRLELTGERLARSLSSDEWSGLFHGVAGPAIEFTQLPLSLLLVQAAPLNGGAAERSAFQAELTALAAQEGGALDRFERDATVLLFEQPEAALRTALAILRQQGPGATRLALHDTLAQVARFSTARGGERTLVGGEVDAARRAAQAQGNGLSLSPAAWAALREPLREPVDGVVFSARFEGPGVLSAFLLPMPANRTDAAYSRMAGAPLAPSTSRP